LLLSTLHTNDATSSVSRLMDMGIENFLISSTLLGVLAQRLTRKLCPHCKAKINLPEHILDDVDLPKDHYYYKATGCKECDFTGYKGRQAIGELFIIDDDVKMMMKDGYNDYQIREAMKQKGMKTISDRLKELLIDGETSYEEALRVGLMDG
jgi:general secretion pathway protein E